MNVGTFVPLLRGQEFESTMAMFLVVPPNESMHPFSGGGVIDKSVFRIFRTVFAGPKYGLCIRIVIADPGAAA